MKQVVAVAPRSEVPADGESAPVFERAAEVFALLGTPMRLRILQLLCQREMHVGELRAALGSLQPGISQHLALLHRCGALTRRRQGPQVFYAIHPLQGALLCHALRRMLNGRESA